MVTYLDLEDVLMRVRINFTSLDQAIQAMRETMMDTNINLTWREIADTYDGYQNTVDHLREEIKQAFKEMDAIIQSNGGSEEETETQLLS